MRILERLHVPTPEEKKDFPALYGDLAHALLQANHTVRERMNWKGFFRPNGMTRFARDSDLGINSMVMVDSEGNNTGFHYGFPRDYTKDTGQAVPMVNGNPELVDVYGIANPLGYRPGFFAKDGTTIARGADHIQHLFFDLQVLHTANNMPLALIIHQFIAAAEYYGHSLKQKDMKRFKEIADAARKLQDADPVITNTDTKQKTYFRFIEDSKHKLHSVSFTLDDNISQDTIEHVLRQTDLVHHLADTNEGSALHMSGATVSKPRLKGVAITSNGTTINEYQYDYRPNRNSLRRTVKDLSLPLE